MSKTITKTIPTITDIEVAIKVLGEFHNTVEMSYQELLNLLNSEFSNMNFTEDHLIQVLQLDLDTQDIKINYRNCLI